ncbi:methionine biosynthesis protein MetW [Leptospira hartskeerlii]|uniref:Methionine biosynthesis protein MetW n=1 Tax=Leptospira hartskeerlii TaxID=2023177 RepID=A0A2M9XEX4_9LEPT|nr:methionine biosynthesis protein MetW [Leptospira hartskeerlii]PJZ26238.1 methionine biosynthesis protein MetW [Leptospira hartskeerlii]PJZ34322.1 methionine biosynthesis protein MetW [Leptospira hartskeerlii]
MIDSKILSSATLSERPDFAYILDTISPGSRVLDLGCGNGDLLYLLKQKGIRGQGIEKDEDAIVECIRKGVYVHHGDIDEGLSHHEDKRFDYVILNQTIQETRHPGDIIKECLRIGKRVIIVFPNFGYWEVRFRILFQGKTPVTDLLPYRWFNTPNLHFLSVLDFQEFCDIRGFTVEDKAFFTDLKQVKFSPNFFAKLALFQIR